MPGTQDRTLTREPQALSIPPSRQGAPIRVVHLYHDFFPTRGGIEDTLANLTQAQAGQGQIAPMVLCANSVPLTRIETIHGVPVIRAASWGRVITPFCPGWPAWLRRLRPDIVHLHLPCPLGEWALCLTPGVPRILVSLHNDYVRPDLARRLHYPLHRAILRRAAAIIAGTPDYAQTSPVLMDLQAKVRIIPYGIPLESYAAAALRPPPASPHDARILSAGRLCYYKGIEVLLAAAPAILGQIDIVGDGPWRQRLQAQARRFGLAERVHFAGAVTEDRLIEHLRASYLFVFPSTARSEAFGLAQLKAMASALPVVSSNLPGVSWLNRHGATGLIVPPRAPQALAEAINHLLTDRPLYAQLAHGARAHAQQFTVQRMSNAIAEVYSELVAQHPSAHA